MSEESPLPREHPAPAEVGPWAEIIADILRQLDDSQHKLAALVTESAYELEKSVGTVHASAVSRWLTGVVARPRYRRWIAHACASAGIPVSRQQLDAAAEAQHRQRRSRHARVAHVEQPADVVQVRTDPHPTSSPTVHEAAVDSDDVKRRAFAQLLAQAGIGMLTAGWGIDPDRWSAALSGTRVDATLVDGMEAFTTELMQRAPAIAATSLLPAVRGHLQGLRETLLWTPPAQASRVRSMAGQTALLAGYLMLQDERRTEADACWSLALGLADVAGDDRLRAALMVHQAWRWEDNNLLFSIALLDRAASLLGTTSDPAISAMVLSVRGSKHAQAAQTDPTHATLAMRDLDAAQTSLSRVNAREDGLYVFGSIIGQAIESRGWALLHLTKPRDAAADLQLRLASMNPSSLAWRSYAMSGLAAATASMGDPEHASELLRTSLEFAGNASSPRCAKIAAETRQRWLAGYDGPAARRLDENLREVSRPPADPPDGHSGAR
jgi:hypothetical protein